MDNERAEHLGETLEHLSRYWESQHRAAVAQGGRKLPNPAFTIALSREVGAQGTLIAQDVGNRLGWHVYDDELLERIAQDMGIRAVLLKSVDERRQSWLTESFDALLAAPVKSEWNDLVTESAYVHHLIKTILALGAHGECVIVGRGAGFVLPAATTLRVCLVGAVPERVATWSRKLGISKTEAARQVRTIDRERTNFVQDHFLKDPADPRNYDIVLNAPRLPLAQNAEIIVEMLRRLQAAALQQSTVRPVP